MFFFYVFFMRYGITSEILIMSAGAGLKDSGPAAIYFASIMQNCNRPMKNINRCEKSGCHANIWHTGVAASFIERTLRSRAVCLSSFALLAAVASLFMLALLYCYSVIIDCCCCCSFSISLASFTINSFWRNNVVLGQDLYACYVVACHTRCSQS